MTFFKQVKRKNKNCISFLFIGSIIRKKGLIILKDNFTINSNFFIMRRVKAFDPQFRPRTLAYSFIIGVKVSTFPFLYDSI